MRQFLLSDRYAQGEAYLLNAAERRYLVNVLRLKSGDSLICLDGERNHRLTGILHCEGGQYSLHLSDQGVPVAASPGLPHIRLFQCLPKGKKMDLIVRQAVESGVAHIHPVESEHSQIRPAKGEGSTKIERWRRIVTEAVQQSGRDSLPCLHQLTDISSLAEGLPDDCCKLFFHEKPLANIPLHHYLSECPAEIALVIGPEGGLSDTELQLLVSAGFNAISLGRNVLRCETAALYAVAAVQILCLEMDAWQPKPMK